MKAYAVIGAGYGDEGKGLVTDYIAQTNLSQTTGKPPLVARGNGGAQAGHTVHYGKKRFVHGHTSSGTFAGSDTYLGSQFIVNPLMLDAELLKLADLDERPNIYVHPFARVTTIYDMAINSLAEIKRGGKRHGSCGAGINETVTRHAAGYHITPDMLRNDALRVSQTIRSIQRDWIPKRLAKHGIDMYNMQVLGPQADPYIKALFTDRSDHTDDLARLAAMMRISYGPSVNTMHDTMITEGAQGLMLDEFLGEFPHVTRSITGLPSHIQVAAECGATEIQPIYVTRAYVTRHGAGPMAHEGQMISDGLNVVDPTNAPNEWQGTIRYAPLDVDRLGRVIGDDLERAGYAKQMFGVNVLPPKLIVTCMDQLGDDVTINQFDFVNEQFSIPSTTLPKYLAKKLGIQLGATVHGPAATDVRLADGKL